MKTVLKKALHKIGYEIHPLTTTADLTIDGFPNGNLEVFLRYLRDRGFRPTSILDVGANIAGWSRSAKNIFPSSNCFLIEPQVEMKESLEQFCQDYPGSKYFLVGVGGVSAELPLAVSDDLLGSTFLASKETNSEQKRYVQVVTIDSLIESGAIPIPQLVKLDIQGFELPALRGGQTLFGNAEVFILEVSLFEFSGHPLFHEVVEFMVERGYVVYDFAGFIRRPHDKSLGQVDVCFVKRDSFLRRDSHLW